MKMKSKDIRVTIEPLHTIHYEDVVNLISTRVNLQDAADILDTVHYLYFHPDTWGYELLIDGHLMAIMMFNLHDPHQILFVESLNDIPINQSAGILLFYHTEKTETNINHLSFRLFNYQNYLVDYLKSVK